jgi:flagellar hook-associated protein 2
MAISSLGIGANLPSNDLLKQLMAVEQEPLKLLDKKETSYQAKLSGFGILKGALSQFQTSVNALSSASQFQGVKATISDSSVLTITGSPKANVGGYSIEVTKLAQAQKLATVGVASDTQALSNGVISFDLGTIAGGTFDSDTGKYTGAGRSFTSSGTGIKTVTITDSNNSLQGIRDAVNQANIGVTASIINDGSGTPYRLSFSVTDTGKANSLKISVANDPVAVNAPLSDLLNQDPAGVQNLKETQTAQNSEFRIDGITTSKSSNTVTDAISGVTLNLLKTNTGNPAAAIISRDTAAVTTAINSFVKAYNDITQTLRDSSAYDPKTKKGAILNGEASVRTIQNQIRSILTTPVAGGNTAYSVLSAVGVSMQKTGLLEVDNTKLQAAMSANFSAFANLFAATGNTSDSLISYSAATSATAPGSYDVNITQLATQGKSIATAAAGLTIQAGINDTLQIQLDGLTSTITLDAAVYADATALSAQIQSKINSVADFKKSNSTIAVSQNAGILTLTSSRYGSASNIIITGGNGQANLQFAGATNTTGLDVAGKINGISATGSGQKLTATSSSAANGISIVVTGGALGDRGTVSYSQGYAYQFGQLSTSLLGTGGPIAARIDGINSSIKGIGENRNDLNLRLAATEKRYRAMFSNLDLTISRMTSTSNYLAQQLANLTPK